MKTIYVEKKVGFDRQFEIDDKKINIKQKSVLDPEIDANIDLSVLKPEPETILYTQVRFALVTSLFIIFLILFSIIWNNISFLRWGPKVYAFAFCFLAYIVILFKTRKKIEYKNFKNKDEIVIFDVGKVGKYKKEYDEFIQLIIKEIKEIRF
jgi:Ca2+/Na+ antiporter